MSREYDYIPSQEEIDWYREHPEQLERYADSHRNYRQYLLRAFLLGLGLAVAAKLIEAGMAESEFWNAAAEFLYDLGVSIWGAVVAIYLLEISFERKQRRIQTWYNAVKSAIADKD